MSREVTPVEERLNQPPRLTAAFKAGDMLGQYRIDYLLGDGGMGAVYRCTDLTMNRPVAVKVLHSHLLTTDKWFLRFRQEAMAISRLQHPAIIKIYQFSSDDPPFIVMDYVRGTPLSDVLAGEGSLSLERSLMIGRQITDALAHAHSRGIVHRDLKPSNIMMLERDAIQILDFGIARFEDGSETPIKLTQTGEVFGSPAYMSPEQVMGKKVGSASDQYSFGCLLYECLTGNPPFLGSSPIDVMMRHASDEAPISLKEATLGKSFPPHIEQLLKKLLAKKPEDRFGSMDEVHAALTIDNHPDPSAQIEKRAQAGIAAQSMAKKLLAALAIAACVAVPANWLFHNLYDKIKLPAPAPKPAQQPAPVAPMMSDEEKEQASANTDFERDLKARAADKEEHPGRALKYSGPRQTSISDEALANFKTYLPDLQQLELNKCPFLTDKAWQYLEHLPLRTLLLNRLTGISNADIANICKIKTLKRLELGGTSITDEGLAMLNKLPDLEQVDLGTTKATATGLENFVHNHKKLTYFSVLSFEDNWANGGDLNGMFSVMARRPLERLTVSGVNVVSEQLEMLAKIKSLNSLYLNDTVVEPDGLKAILKMKKLQNLLIKAWSDIPNDQMSQLNQQNPRLLVSTSKQGH